MEATEIPVESAPVAARPKPLWKRVLQFPLTALVIAIVILILAQALAAAAVALTAGRPVAETATPTNAVFALVVRC